MISKFEYKYDVNPKDFERIKMEPSIFNYTSYKGANHFSFLNIDHKFESKIDWDFNKYGKLWTYNLNYFEFLNQENTQNFQSEYEILISDFTQRLPNLRNACEPFPTSLRIINWIKYFIINDNCDSKWNSSLYSQSLILRDNIEYHLLGNHLLENGFALTMAGIYFQDANLYKQGVKILEDELTEQILADGAHFELSPMYHCLMLYRLLDTINIMKSNSDLVNRFSANQDSFFYFLKSKGELMISWLKAISYDDGSYPHFNDSTNGIAPEVFQLLNYAKSLNLSIHQTKLNDSGYRRFKNKNFDVTVKAGKIGPDYIPAHAHADSLNFVCSFKGSAFLVDPGISTYENNQIRKNERSSNYHNVVATKNQNTSQIWGAFRVGSRSNVMILNESKDLIDMELSNSPFKHRRKLVLSDENLILTDRASNVSTLYLHFHPDYNVRLINGMLKVENLNIEISFIGNVYNITLMNYSYCDGFNKRRDAYKVDVLFSNEMESHFNSSIN
jgi:hypothetical protein